MYSSYAGTILALRAKASFSYPHRSLYCHRSENRHCCCCCCSCGSGSGSRSRESSTGFPLYGVSINPSFIYSCYLRQSSLIYWAAPSRGLRRASCGPDGPLREMIGLLAEAEERFREITESSWEDEVEIEKSFSRDLKNSSANDGGRSKASRRGSNVGRRGNRSSSDYRSESSMAWSGDLEVQEGGRGRINGRSSSNYRSGVDDVEREVREVKKYVDSARSEKEKWESRRESEFREGNNNARASSLRKVHGRKVRDRVEEEEEEEEERVSLLVDSGRRVREEYVRGEQQVVGQSESRGGSRRVERMTDVRKDDRGRVYGRMDSAREAREEYKGEEQRAVRQQKLSEGSKQVTSVSEVREDDVERAFQSTRSTHEAREEYVTGQKGVIGQRESREGVSRRVMRIAEIHEDDKKRDSGSMDFARKARGEYVREERHIVGQRESRDESLKLARISETHEDDTRRASSSTSVADTRMVDKEASSTSAVRQHAYLDQQVVGHTRSDRSSQKLTDISEIHGSNIERASHAQRHSEEMRMKDTEEVSSSEQIKEEQKARKTIQEVKKIDLNSKHEYNVNITTANVSDTGKSSSSWSNVDTAGVEQEGYTSTSAISLVRGRREQQNRAGEQVVQQNSSKKESERSTNLSQLSRSSTERISNSQETSNTRIENQKENSTLVFARDERKEKNTLIGESSQSTKAQTAYRGSFNSGSSSIQVHSSELDDQINRDDMYELGEQINRDDIYLVKDDVMESVRRSDKSSALYVGEFVEKVQEELSASDMMDNTFKQYSEVQMEVAQRGASQVSTEPLGGLDATTKNKDKKLIQESARPSSSRSGPKGPSDEMWDVRGLSSDEPSSKAEPEEDASPGEVNSNAADRIEGAITRRAHRSLWTYVADIIRKGWHPSAETQASTLKSGTRSSSNESASSEAWFSGHEPDENEDETETKEGIGTLKEPVPNKRPASHSPISIQGASEALGLGDKVPLLEASTSTSLGSMRRGPVGGSPASQPGHVGWIEGEGAQQGGLSPVATAVQSSSLTSVTASATVEEEKTEIQKPGSESAKVGEELIGEKLPEYGGTEGKDGELKRRKLQRNKQVMREQFDEWEEAYKHENQQRKVDEFFMREALLEAKKAADIWEVPVGAVLVQNGKVIARGCNLVEELRDSTAHAEMMCIREASNVLQTWRLADTTLYVTLEPCPMCAGAILQARIDNVVWGAPNKLLGADGSWVRLFPGDGGSNSLDPSNQIAGPVHPFHPKITIKRGVLAIECTDVMQQFFQLRRKKIKKPEPPPPSCLPISTYPTKLLTKMHDIFCAMFCL